MLKSRLALTKLHWGAQSSAGHAWRNVTVYVPVEVHTADTISPPPRFAESLFTRSTPTPPPVSFAKQSTACDSWATISGFRCPLGRAIAPPFHELALSWATPFQPGAEQPRFWYAPSRASTLSSFSEGRRRRPVAISPVQLIHSPVCQSRQVDAISA